MYSLIFATIIFCYTDLKIKSIEGNQVLNNGPGLVMSKGMKYVSCTKWNEFWTHCEGVVTLKLRLDHFAIKKLYLDKLEKNRFRELSTNPLDHQFDSDLTILAGGETNKEKGIMCHKFMLSSPI